MAGRHSTVSLLAVVMLGLALGGCATSPDLTATGSSQAGPPSHQAPAALVPAGDWATAYTYTLDRLPSCELGDALTVVMDRAAHPLRITDLAVTVTGAAPATERSSTEVIAVRAGSTTGELAASYQLPHLAGSPAEPADDALLLPVATSRTWYGIEIRLRVLGDTPAPWAITALTVSYRLGRHSYTAEFPQFVHLPPVADCPR